MTNSPTSPTSSSETARGAYRNRTGLDGFAGSGSMAGPAPLGTDQVISGRCETHGIAHLGTYSGHAFDESRGGRKTASPTAVGRISDRTGSRACIVFGPKDSLRRSGRAGKNRGGQRKERRKCARRSQRCCWPRRSRSRFRRRRSERSIILRSSASTTPSAAVVPTSRTAPGVTSPSSIGSQQVGTAGRAAARPARRTLRRSARLEGLRRVEDPRSRRDVAAGDRLNPVFLAKSHSRRFLSGGDWSSPSPSRFACKQHSPRYCAGDDDRRTSRLCGGRTRTSLSRRTA